MVKNALLTMKLAWQQDHVISLDLNLSTFFKSFVVLTVHAGLLNLCIKMDKFISRPVAPYSRTINEVRETESVNLDDCLHLECYETCEIRLESDLKTITDVGNNIFNIFARWYSENPTTVGSKTGDDMRD